MTASVPDSFCFEKLLTTGSISLINTGLFRLSISSWVSFGRCVFQGIHLFHLSYQICAHSTVHNIPLFYPLNVHGICTDVSYFNSDISNLCPLFFLAWLGSLILLIFSKSQVCFVDFFYWVPIFSVIGFCCNFYCAFLSLFSAYFGFNLLFF